MSLVRASILDGSFFVDLVANLGTLSHYLDVVARTC